MPFMGSRGDSYSNALAESLNGLYKAEVVHRRRSLQTVTELEIETLKWVSWFNHQRLLAPIGYIPPAEVEANYSRSQTEQPMPARLKPTGLLDGWGGSVFVDNENS